MFSGIIKASSIAKSVTRTKNSMDVVFRTPLSWNLEIGESINIDGVCSTVKTLDNSEFSVYYMPETLSKTALGTLQEDHIYNLERCITLETLISGHLVYGHVDTTAEVIKILKIEDSCVIKFKLDKNFTKYIVYKGSIAVNGISLTVVSVDKNSFSVSLIPHTLSVTNLGALVVGDLVNIEVDMMAKHVEKLLENIKK